MYSKKYALKIWGYCLMSNHVHFIAVPMEDDSLAKTFNYPSYEIFTAHQLKAKKQRTPMAGTLLFLCVR